MIQLKAATLYRIWQRVSPCTTIQTLGTNAFSDQRQMNISKKREVGTITKIKKEMSRNAKLVLLALHQHFRKLSKQEQRNQKS